MFLFLVGTTAYTIHIGLLVGTNFVLNITTYFCINLIYVFSIFPFLI